MMGGRKQVGARLSIASRALAGTLGAYGLTSLFTTALSLLLAWLGMARTEAVIAATLASFAMFAVIAMSVFHARSATRAWRSLAGSAALLALIWLLLAGSGP